MIWRTRNNLSKWHGAFLGLFGGGSDYTIDAEFWKDPYYKKSQKSLYGIGNMLLEGKPNEYYAPIGEIGGSIFEDFLHSVGKDTLRSTEEALARRGVRGGRAGRITARTMGDLSAKYRYADFLRALKGREGFLQTGKSAMGNVMQGALSMTGMKNNFELNKGQFNAKMRELQDSKEASMWSSILGSGIGAIGNIWGAGQLSKAIAGLNDEGDSLSGVMSSYGASPDISSIKLLGSPSQIQQDWLDFS